MAVSVNYSSDDEDGVIVHVNETRERPPGQTGSAKQLRSMSRGFGSSAKAQDDGLIFVHGVQHGEIKLDDILPSWED
jgi:hypothetical protein